MLVQLFYRLVGVFVANDKTQVDVGSTAGNHDDIHIRERTKNFAGNSTLLSELTPDYRNDRYISKHSHVAKLFQISDNLIQLISVV